MKNLFVYILLSIFFNVLTLPAILIISFGEAFKGNRNLSYLVYLLPTLILIPLFIWHYLANREQMDKPDYNRGRSIGILVYIIIGLAALVYLFLKQILDR